MFQNKSIKINNTEVSYIDEGTSNNVLLLIHGFSFKVGFTPLIELLKKDFRVIAPDLPGFGLSKEADFMCNSENYIKFLGEFLDRLNISNLSVFGNSMGGYLALLFAYNHPSKVNKIVVRSPLFTNNQLPKKYGSKLMLLIYENLSKNKLILNYLKTLFFKNFSIFAAKNAKDKALYEEIRTQQENNITAKVAKDILLDLAKADIRDKLPKINQHTLILWGNNDGILSARYADELLKLLPNSKVSYKSDEVHCIVTLDAEDLASDIRNFCLQV